MLNKEHFVGDKFYRINTIVGVITQDAIKEYEFLGFTKFKDDKNIDYIIHHELSYYGESDSYDFVANDRLVFENKEDAEKYINYYNNGREFINLNIRSKYREHY